MPLHVGGPPTREGSKNGAIPDRPREKGDLIDRRVEGDRIALLVDKVGHRAAIAGEARDELRREEVHIIGKAVVAEVPEHLNALLPRRRDERRERGEIVPPCAVHEMPAHGVARGLDANRPQECVVRRHLRVMLYRRDDIEPRAVDIDVRRGFIPRDPERLKEPFRR